MLNRATQIPQKQLLKNICLLFLSRASWLANGEKPEIQELRKKKMNPDLRSVFAWRTRVSRCHVANQTSIQ